MNLAAWQLQTPLDALIFDCDGTLSQLEGIDELAKNRGVAASVTAMTAAAMGQTGINADLYQERLKLVQPTYEEVRTLGENYVKTLAPKAVEVFKVFQKLHKPLYILSAGLYPAVLYLGQRLELPADHVFAVDIHFDQQGHYLDFDHDSPLIENQGKRKIIAELQKKHPRLLLLGDGLNDVVAQDLVTRFIGYGGNFYREKIAALCQYYFKTASFSALLPLALTFEEQQSLDSESQALFDQGLQLIADQQVLIT